MKLITIMVVNKKNEIRFFLVAMKLDYYVFAFYVSKRCHKYSYVLIIVR